MFQILDIYGKPLLTWDNLLLFITCSITLYYALKIRLTIEIMSRGRRRK